MGGTAAQPMLPGWRAAATHLFSRSSTASSARLSSSTRIMSPRRMACKGRDGGSLWVACGSVGALCALKAFLYGWRGSNQATTRLDAPRKHPSKWGSSATASHLHQRAISPLKGGTHARHRLCQPRHRRLQLLQLHLLQLLLGV